MKRRAFVGGLTASLAAASAHAQPSRDYSRMSAANLMALAQRQERDWTAQRAEDLPLHLGQVLDTVEIWIAAHDAQGRENDHTMRPLFEAATLLKTPPEIAEGLLTYAAPAGDAEMQRVLLLADAVRSRVDAVSGRYRQASSSHDFLEWQSMTRGFSARATILAAAWLRVTTNVREAIAAAERRLEPISGWYTAHALALGHSMLGNDADALAQARRAASWARQGFERTARRPANELDPAIGDANITAAYAGARTGAWRQAWTHLLFARTLSENMDSVARLERRLWTNFDGVATLVLDDIGAQLWLATRQNGWEATRRFDLPELRRIDVQRFMFQIRSAENGEHLNEEHVGWAVIALAEGLTDLRRRLSAFEAHAPSGFAEAFSAMMRAARAAGVARLAWMPSPAFALFPVGAIVVDGVPAITQTAISTIASPAELETDDDASPTHITRTVAFAIDGGDEDIPLAQFERECVDGIGQRAVNGAAALHIASHAEIREGRLHFKTGANAWINVDQLSRSESWRTPPRLVVLSACGSAQDPVSFVNTAWENNVRVNSPALELVAKGAAAVIGTLWPINDLTAFMFSTRLHIAMIEQGLAPLAAFQASVAWLRSVTGAHAAEHVEMLANQWLSAEGVEEVLGRLTELEPERPFANAYHWAAWTYWGV